MTIMEKSILTSVLLFAAFVFTSCGGGDDNAVTPGDVYIRFSVNNGDNGSTRAGQAVEDVGTYVMNVTGGGTCLLSVSETDGFPETTTDAATRGMPVETVGGMTDFSTYCYNESGGVFYENIAAGNNGQLKERKTWPQGRPLRFYAIHPYDAEKASFLSSPTGFGYTYTVNTNVAQQADLMYASTGLTSFNTDGLARLHFHHALAAVRVKTGSVSGNIASVNAVTFKNVRGRGTLTLPVADEASATWTIDNGAEYVRDYALTGLNVTDLTQGTVLNPNEKTFLMLPQSLDNVTIEIKVTLTGGTSGIIRQSLAGESAWAAGKTRTYTVNVQ